MEKIENLNRKLKQLQKEIQIYQEKCNHKYQHIKFDKKNSARWYCKDCELQLRLPSVSELDEWTSGG